MSQDTGARVLPASFEHHLIHVTPVTVTGVRLSFFTDTGGGQWMLRTAADGLGLLAHARMEAFGDDEVLTVPVPPFRTDAWIPPPNPDHDSVPVLEDVGGDGSHFQRRLARDGHSGMLCQQWFSRRIWEIDYPAERLVLHAVEPSHPAGVRCVPLGFPAPPHEAAQMPAFPRIQATVDGATLDLLFDTGAHAPLTAAAVDAIGGGLATIRATSFIIGSIFDRWRAAHPDWRVVEDAEESSGAPMIEIPAVDLAGFDTGPVWFTRRRDANFTEWMSQWMDRTIVGALGGNAFRTFRIVLDYPAAQATFCQSVRP
ncbi:MAG: hypothetical protein ACRDP8_25365 [Actinopolymorphaceae bacterium]